MYNKRILQDILNDLDKRNTVKKVSDIDLVSQYGYRDDSPFRNRPSIDIHTPNGLIDMSNTGIPILANGQYLAPYSGMHQFDTDMVTEIPLAKRGGIKGKKYSKSLLATNRLFKKNPLFKKKKYKGKTYDPNAMYFQEGAEVRMGTCPPGYIWNGLECVVDPFDSRPSQRSGIFMGLNGNYDIDPIYDQYARQRFDVEEANRKAQEFNQKYVQSKNFKRLLEKQGYTPEEIQNRIDSVMNINDFRYTDEGPSYVDLTNRSLGAASPEFISYNVTDPGDWPNFDQIAAHEWGHVGVDSLITPLKESERSELINRIKTENAGVTGKETDLQHDMEPQENRADLTQLRQQLQEAGVFDSTKKKKFTAEDLKKYKEIMMSTEDNWNNMWNRMFRLYNDEDIIYLMNNIAMNNSLELNMASYGGDISVPSLTKAQLGTLVKSAKNLGRIANIGTIGTANTLAKKLAPVMINPIHIGTLGFSAGERTMIGPFTGSPLNVLPMGPNLAEEMDFNEAFRYFGDTLDYVKLNKVLDSAHGPLLRMGKNQILSDKGQWFEQGTPNASYTSVFGVRANPYAEGSNLRYMPKGNRNGVLIGDTSTSNPRILDINDPGLQFYRRIPFSNRHIPINMDKLRNDQFDITTMGGNLQSLAERYGYGVLGAAGLGALGYNAPQEYLDEYVNEPIEKYLYNPWVKPAVNYLNDPKTWGDNDIVLKQYNNQGDTLWSLTSQGDTIWPKSNPTHIRRSKGGLVKAQESRDGGIKPPLQKFKPNQIYTFEDRPNSLYKWGTDGKMYIKNVDTDNKFVPIDKDYDARLNVLQKGLASGKTKPYTAPTKGSGTLAAPKSDYCKNPPPTAAEVQAQVLAEGLGPTAEGARRISEAAVKRAEWERRCAIKSQPATVTPQKPAPKTKPTPVKKEQEVQELMPNGRIKTTIQYYDVPTIDTLPIRKAQPIESISPQTPEIIEPSTVQIKRWDPSTNRWITNTVPANSLSARKYREMEEWRKQNERARESSFTEFQDGGELYTLDGVDYMKQNGKWFKKINGEFLPLTKGDVAKRVAYLEANAHPNQEERWKKLYGPVVDDVLQIENMTFYENIENNPDVLDWFGYLISEPDKDDKERNIPPLDPTLREMQAKIKNFSDKELVNLSGINWTSLGATAIPKILNNLPHNISAAEAWKYINHIRKLKAAGYTLQYGGYLPKAQLGRFVRTGEDIGRSLKSSSQFRNMMNTLNEADNLLPSNLPTSVNLSKIPITSAPVEIDFKDIANLPSADRRAALKDLMKKIDLENVDDLDKADLDYESKMLGDVLDASSRDLLRYPQFNNPLDTNFGELYTGAGLSFGSDLSRHLGDFSYKPFSPGYNAYQNMANLATFGKQPLLNRADFANQEEMFIDNLFKKYRSPDIDKELSDALYGIPDTDASDRFKAMMEEAKAEGISPDAILKRSLIRLTNPSQRDIFDRSYPFYLPENWSSSNRAALWNSKFGQYKPFAKNVNEYGTLGGKAPVSFGESGEFDQYYWDQIKQNEDFLNGDYNLSPEQRLKIQSKLSSLYQKGINQGLQQKGFDLENPMRYTGYDAMRTLSPNRYGGEYNVGDEVNQATKEYLEGLGYTFEEI